MDLNNIKDIFTKVSVGEASVEEKDFVESLDENIFFNYLEIFTTPNNSIPAIFEPNLGLPDEGENELEIKYKEVIPVVDDKNHIRLFAKRRGLIKRLFKKQRIRNESLSINK